MQTIDGYEFLEQDGELVLMTGCLAAHPDHDPVFLVSVIENTGYLRRGPGDVYQLPNIPAIAIERLRCQAFVVVVEMQGDRPAHSYDAPAAPLEYDEDAWAVTKAVTIFWHRLKRWTGAGASP